MLLSANRDRPVSSSLCSEILLSLAALHREDILDCESRHFDYTGRRLQSLALYRDLTSS